MTIDFIGLDEIEKDLGKIADPERIRSAITSATSIVQTSAKNQVPVITGRLRNSIHMKVTGYGEETVGKVYTNVEYAPYVEFGTGIRGQGSAYPNAYKMGITYDPTWAGRTAKPFMHPALNQNREKIKKILRTAIEDAV